MTALSAEQRDTLARWGPTAALGALAVYFASGGPGVPVGGPLAAVFAAANLIIHEAGHFLFGFSGEWMGMAGGSLLEVLVPAGLALQGLVWSHRMGTQLALLWTGQALTSVAVYAADAPVRALPLVNDNLWHDWYWLLAHAGKLEFADEIAAGLYGLALVMWALMLAVPLWIE